MGTFRSSSSHYTTTFVVSAATPFVDDRSTILREEIFTATVVGGSVVVDYFKDVNTFDNIQLDTTVALADGRGAQNGRSVFSTSNEPNHATSYAISCVRR
jgi:hypothetical protein